MANDIVTQLVVRGGPAAATELRTFGNELAKVDNAAVSLKSRGVRGLTEFSRGFEDFAISASTGGIAMGLRGATNNINTYLTSLGPIGAAASVAVTAGTVLVGFFERTGKAANDSAAQLTKYKERLTEILNLTEHREQLKQFVSGPNEEKDVFSRIEKAKNDITTIDAQEAMLRKNRVGLLNEQADLARLNDPNRQQNELPVAGESALTALFMSGTRANETKLNNDQLNESFAETNKLMDRRRQLLEDIATLESGEVKRQQGVLQQAEFNARQNLQNDPWKKLADEEAAAKDRQAVLEMQRKGADLFQGPLENDPFAKRSASRPVPGVAAAQAGSRAAYSAIQAAIREREGRGNNAEKVAKQQLTALQHIDKNIDKLPRLEVAPL